MLKAVVDGRLLMAQEKDVLHTAGIRLALHRGPDVVHYCYKCILPIIGLLYLYKSIHCQISAKSTCVHFSVIKLPVSTSSLVDVQC